MTVSLVTLSLCTSTVPLHMGEYNGLLVCRATVSRYYVTFVDQKGAFFRDIEGARFYEIHRSFKEMEPWFIWTERMNSWLERSCWELGCFPVSHWFDASYSALE